MVNTAFMQYCLDVTGSICSIPLNFLLIVAIFKTRDGGKLQPYGYMFLAGACFDVFFGFVELATQHQLLITNGMFFVLPHWLEHDIPFNWTYFTFFLHCFVVSHGVFILAPLYRYRYKIITDGKPPATELLKGLAMTSLCSTVLGISLPFGVYQSLVDHGNDYYMSKLNRSQFNEDVDKYFLYVADIENFGTAFFFYGNFVVLTVCIFISIHYAWEAYKFVGQSLQNMSAKTRSLQRQFTKSLMLQTINAVVFAVFPMSLVSLSMMLKIDASFIGVGVMTPLSWLPTANATITLYCVKAYRLFVLETFGCAKWGKKIIPTTTMSEHSKQQPSTIQIVD